MVYYQSLNHTPQHQDLITIQTLLQLKKRHSRWWLSESNANCREND